MRRLFQKRGFLKIVKDKVSAVTKEKDEKSGYGKIVARVFSSEMEKVKEKLDKNPETFSGLKLRSIEKKFGRDKFESHLSLFNYALLADQMEADEKNATRLSFLLREKKELLRLSNVLVLDAKTLLANPLIVSITTDPDRKEFLKPILEYGETNVNYFCTQTLQLSFLSKRWRSFPENTWHLCH